MEKNIKIIFGALAIVLICFVMFNTSLTGAWGWWGRRSRRDVTCPEVKPIGEPYCMGNNIVQKYMAYRSVRRRIFTSSCEPYSTVKVLQKCQNGCLDRACIKIEEKEIKCTGLEMVWLLGIRRQPYHYTDDTCQGYRCLVDNEISPACYNLQKCKKVCKGGCINIPLAKEKCKFYCGDEICDYEQKMVKTGDTVVDPITSKKVTLENVGSGGAIQVNVEGTVEVIPADHYELVNDVYIENMETYYEDTMSERAAILRIGESSKWCSQDCLNNECQDSDEGIDYFVKGTTKGLTGQVSDTKTDSCDQTSTFKLTEYYCSGNNLVSKSYDCPFGCDNGACIKEDKTCTDTDGGDNLNIRGTVTGLESPTVWITRTDYCMDERKVVEYDCRSDDLYVMEGVFECRYGCKDGACMGPSGFVIYIDGDPYIGEDPADPILVWDLEGLTTKAATTIFSKDDGSIQKSGIILGIQNYDIRDDDTDNPAGVGECYSLPNNYAQICLDSLTVNDDGYMPVTIAQHNDEDLRRVYPSDKALSSTEDIIKIHGPNLDSFKLNNGLFTNEIFIASVNGGFNVYYRDFSKNPSIRYLDHFDYAYSIGTINYGNNEGIEITLSYSPNAGKLFMISKISSTGALPETNEKITAGFRVISNKIVSLGNISSLEERDELYWQPTMSALPVTVGNVNHELRTQYGIIIRNPKINGASDQVVLKIPEERVQANVVIKGTATTVYRLPDGGTVSVTGGITEDIPLGKAIAETTTWALDWELDDSDISSFQDTTINFDGNVIDIHDAIILSKKSPTVDTSLTSQDWDYESNVFLEKFRRSINYYYYFDDTADLTKVSESNPLIIKFLGKTLNIVGITDNSITVQQ